MDQGFSYGDIIVIGAIAVFILLRYRAMLGEKSGRDEGVRPTNIQLAEYERVIQLPSTRNPAPTAKVEDISAAYGDMAKTLTAMRAIDREFTPEEFLTGARAAYEMLLAAYSKSDRETLKMLLSDALYKSFDATLTEAQKSGKMIDTTLVAITKAELTDAKLKGNQATLSVDFATQQIHLVRDADGKVIEGNPSLQEIVEENWVFTRNLASSDFNWKIIET